MKKILALITILILVIPVMVFAQNQPIIIGSGVSIAAALNVKVQTSKDLRQYGDSIYTQLEATHHQITEDSDCGTYLVISGTKKKIEIHYQISESETGIEIFYYQSFTTQMPEKERPNRHNLLSFIREYNLAERIINNSRKN